ncbi:hypothetical protein [Paenibacillus elgii]|uniref:hypothetical protein n=1 Tax=Paenibacillus elgii TaxID=189691 RepID=UPI00203D7DFE|nr:hypothetical protein [Paenibacillus elgii]MCM3273678.1 hypothetical protein [Paenibacillus elgii]
MPRLEREIQKRIASIFKEYRLYKYLTLRQYQALSKESPEVREERLKFCQHVELGVSELPQVEQTIIKNVYMDKEASYNSTVRIAEKMPMSLGTFYKIRNEAFCKLVEWFGQNEKGGKTMAGKWKQELIFIKRDENGVIVGISEKTPEGYVDPVDEEITENTRYNFVENK